MKKLFLNFMTIVFAMSLVLVSCDPKDGNDDTTPDDPNGDGNVEQEQPTTPPSLEEQGYTVANAAFGTAYPMHAYTNLILANETDTLVISLNTEGEETLSVGEYTMDDSGTYPAGTWDPEYSMLWNVAMLSDGTVSVTKAGRNYTVKTDCVDENGDSVKWVYTGQVDLEVYTQQSAQAEFNLTWDDFDTEYTYYQYVSQYGLYAYTLAIVDPETGWELDLQFTGNGTDTNGKLPTGSFTMATTAVVENIILPGWSQDGQVGGSYVIDWSNADATFNPFVDGSFNITEADGNTTLNGSFFTESGDEVVVNVTGTTPTDIYFYNPSGAPAKKSIVAKQGRTISKRFMRK